MSTYRNEWDCCGAVTETDSYEPDACPFCLVDTLTEQARALEEGAQYILTLCENENVPDMLTKYPEDGHLVALINIKRVAKQMKKFAAKEAE